MNDTLLLYYNKHIQKLLIKPYILTTLAPQQTETRLQQHTKTLPAYNPFPASLISIFIYICVVKLVHTPMLFPRLDPSRRKAHHNTEHQERNANHPESNHTTSEK